MSNDSIDSTNLFPSLGSLRRSSLSKAARKINTWFVDGGRFDLVTLGVLQATLLAAAAGLLVYQLARLSLFFGVLGASFVFFVLADSTHACFLNSLFTEPAGLIALVALAGLILPLPRVSRHPRWSCIYVGTFLLATLFLSFAKIQYAPLAFPLGIACVIATRQSRRHFQIGSALLVALTIVASARDLDRRVPGDLWRANLYNLVFSDILPYAEDPSQVLRELGLSDEFRAFSGTYAYHPKSGRWIPGLRKELDRMGRLGLVTFLARHPKYLFSMLSVGRKAQGIWNSRLDYLGNFTQEPGIAPRAQSWAFAGWSSLRSRLFGSSLFSFGLLLGVSSILAVWRLIKTWNSDRETIYWLQLLLVFVAGGQLLICLLGEGTYELAKHFFLGRVAADALCFFLLGYLIRGTAILIDSAASNRRSAAGGRFQ